MSWARGTLSGPDAEGEEGGAFSVGLHPWANMSAPTNESVTDRLRLIPLGLLLAPARLHPIRQITQAYSPARLVQRDDVGCSCAVHATGDAKQYERGTPRVREARHGAVQQPSK